MGTYRFIKHSSNYGDILAIPFFLSMIYYFYSIKDKSILEYILYFFSISGFILDSFFTYMFLNRSNTSKE